MTYKCANIPDSRSASPFTAQARPSHHALRQAVLVPSAPDLAI